MAEKIEQCPRCKIYGQLRYLKIGSNRDIPLVECVACGWNSILPGETEEEK